MATGRDDARIEAVRGFWNARPCNVRHSPRPIGERAYFDEVEARKYRVEPHIPRFARFSDWKAKRVLEIGCGIGTDAINFARAGARVTAVDLSERSIEIARQRARIFGLDGVRFAVADAERLEETLPVEPHDLVYSFGAIHHTPRPDRALRALRPFVAPDGTLKLMLYHRRSWKALGILLRHGRGAVWRLDRLIAEHSEAQSGCPVTHTYTQRSARRLLADAGFEIREVAVEHIFPYVVSDYVAHRYQKVWYFDLLPEAAFRRLERHLGWHLCITAAPR